MTLYMLYYSKYKPGARDRLADIRHEFKEVYQEHGVEINGFWENEADTTEVHFMTKYENEIDYRRKVEKLQSDERYKKLTSELGDIRESIKVTRLTPLD